MYKANGECFLSLTVWYNFERWSEAVNTHVSGERKFSPLSSAHMLWSELINISTLINCCGSCGGIQCPCHLVSWSVTHNAVQQLIRIPCIATSSSTIAQVFFCVPIVLNSFLSLLIIWFDVRVNQALAISSESSLHSLLFLMGVSSFSWNSGDAQMATKHFVSSADHWTFFFSIVFSAFFPSLPAFFPSPSCFPARHAHWWCHGSQGKTNYF